MLHGTVSVPPRVVEHFKQTAEKHDAVKGTASRPKKLNSLKGTAFRPSVSDVIMSGFSR
jgi:hypothetical protein